MKFEEQISLFTKILLSGNQKLNLISKSTEPDIYQRHILDSIQLAEFIDLEKSIVDFGSGAGLPAIILALMGAKNITMIEKSPRKTQFLNMVIQKLSLNNASVINDAVQNIKPLQRADIITARAFAPLTKLLQLTFQFSDLKTRYILPKGKNYKNELIDAEHNGWCFNLEIKNSITSGEGKILILTNVNNFRRSKSEGRSR